MIEITIRVKNPETARRLAHTLRTAADAEPDRGQARAYRGAARRLERLTRPFRYTPRTSRPNHPEIDTEAVRRAVLGRHPIPMLTRDEARLACWHLTARQHSAAEIADRIGITERTVSRWRAEDRQAVSP